MTPRVSLGLLVFNGESYIARAIESLLAQTFADFELIISDNASTDGTGGICEHYASRDPRIRYTRCERNIGAAGNFNRVFSLSRGEYFKWVAHDDLYHERFLEECVKFLDRSPGVVLCSTDLAVIDARGNTVRTNVERPRAEEASASRRFRALVFNGPCYEMVSGLMRRDAVRRVPPVGRYAHSDGIFLARLGLLGPFHEIPECLFYYREHPASSHIVHRTYRDYVLFFDPEKAGKILLPRWRMGAEYARSVRPAGLGFTESVRCYAHVGRWMVMSWKGLGANVLFAGLEIAGATARFPRRLWKGFTGPAGRAGDVSLRAEEMR